MISSKLLSYKLKLDSQIPSKENDNFNKIVETPQTMLDCNTHKTIHQSSCMISLIHEEIKQIPVYLLNSFILNGSNVNENMRAKIRNFIMKQCQAKLYQRQTCVLACSYVDLYFLNGGVVMVQDVQTLVISCLILACKFKDSINSLSSYNLYKAKDLAAWEIRLLKRLKFYLNPPTYFNFAERIVVLWDEFLDKQQSQLSRFGKVESEINFKLRNFYQQLDLIYMTLKSLSYNVEQLTLNLFYLHVRKNYLGNLRILSLLSKRECTRKFYQQDELKLFFVRFIKFYTTKQLNLKAEIGAFLLNFVFWQAQKNEIIIMKEKQPLSQLKGLDRLQTLPKDGYKMIKELIKKLRKGNI